MTPRALLAIAGLLASSTIARAHEHPGQAEAVDDTTVTASIALTAAQFDTMDYGGDYEGTALRVGATHDRFGASVGVGLYRLFENGRDVFGLGDATIDGTMVLVHTASVMFGTSAMVMVPTGARADGLGMGHPMGMAIVHATCDTGPVQLLVSTGFSRAMLIDAIHHVHGAWPLVDPMNMSEVVWSAGVDAPARRRGLVLGGHVWGGIPVGAPGITRVESGVRLGWIRGKVSTAAELQLGLVGDPYTVRGIFETSVTF